MRLQWKNLLCDTRLRNLLEGKPPAGYSDILEDRRTNFDRDYDRVVFATPVRRLQDKWACLEKMDINSGGFDVC